MNYSKDNNNETKFHEDLMIKNSITANVLNYESPKSPTVERY